MANKRGPKEVKRDRTQIAAVSEAAAARLRERERLAAGRQSTIKAGGAAVRPALEARELGPAGRALLG